MVGVVVTCKPCEQRRAGLMQALSRADAIKAAEHAMKGLAEMLKLKQKEDNKDG